ncbi:MAG: Rid family hydrolase, partial [Rhodospirillales bacterium]|nr:Rid family hydrolase [Rhodospirillales bacterium]
MTESGIRRVRELTPLCMPVFGGLRSVAQSKPHVFQYARNEIIMSTTRMDLNARMSQIVIHNGIVYLSGQVAEDWSAGIVGQTEQILKKIENLLAKAGSDKSKILS